MRYEVILTDAARRSLGKMPSHIQKRIARWLELLQEDPFRAGTRQLVGHAGIRRVHASKDYVILYTVEHEKIAVIVLRIENRRDVYRGM